LKDFSASLVCQGLGGVEKEGVGLCVLGRGIRFGNLQLSRIPRRAKLGLSFAFRKVISTANGLESIRAETTKLSVSREL